MRLTSLGCRSDVLPGIFGRYLQYLVVLIAFRFIKNENGLEHLHYLLSDLI